ncbi:Rdx family protein [Arcobacter sp. YIC-464]|uniref:Rdx family protein n=1 Tax=Arcobacter sp. YIC-464 TaxID=3376631 RepID=UPI003C1806FB
MPRASRVEEEIIESFPHANIELKKSSGGDFRVLLNEKTIYDKLNITQTFPKIGEITQLIKQEL